MRGEDDVRKDQDDYELVAKDDLATLRKEVENVKKNPVQNYESSLTLIEAMDHLADQISRLLDLFERANKEMQEDYQKGLHRESQKLDTVIAQNEKIARGILALVDRDGAAKQRVQQSEQQASSDDGGQYPLRGPQSQPEAPWKDSSAHSESRRSLMKEFR